MARCEDFPCCGHELGCCPDYDESGRQLNMKCVCGTTLPLNSRSSICAGCMHDPDDPDQYLPDDEPYDIDDDRNFDHYGGCAEQDDPIEYDGDWDT